MFLRNEFSKISDNLFEMTFLQRWLKLIIKLKNKNLSIRPKVDVGCILKLVGSKIFNRKFLGQK